MKIKVFTTLLISLVYLNSYCEKDTLWTSNDIINQEQIKYAQINPSGKNIVWYKTIPEKNKDLYIRDIYLTNINKGNSYRLTNTNEIENQMFGTSNNFIFSQSGEIVYYVLNKKNKSILYSKNINGGQSEIVDSFKLSISGIKMLKQDHICFISRENKNLATLNKTKAKDDITVVESLDEFFPTRIFSYNIKTGKIKRLTNNIHPVMNYEVSKDGTMLITSHVLSPSFSTDGKPDPEYYLWDLKKGTKKQILTDDTFFNLHGFAFTKDNSGFYFINEKVGDIKYKSYGISIPYFFDLKSMKSIELPISWKNGINDRNLHLTGNNLFLNLSDGPKNKLVFLEKVQDNWKVKEIINNDFTNNFNSECKKQSDCLWSIKCLKTY